MVWVRDRDRERAAERARALAAVMRRHPVAGRVRLTGPAPAPLERLRGEWRFQIAVRGASGRDVRELVAAGIGERADPGILVDVDPYQLL